MESDNVIFLERGIRKAERRLWNFSYPHQVVGDPDLSMDEKRAILAAWASDEHAVDSMPTLRHLPGTPAAVTFASIMDARARLDRLAGAANDDDPPPSPVKFRHAATWEPFKGAA